MSRHPPEPTGEQCTAHAPIAWTDDRGNACNGFAIWYPQMGGYVGKCAVEPSSDCFEAWVWHDGEFPFSEDSDHGPGHPIRLHHCMAEQFVRFGEAVAERMAKREVIDIGGVIERKARP